MDFPVPFKREASEDVSRSLLLGSELNHPRQFFYHRIHRKVASLTHRIHRTPFSVFQVRLHRFSVFSGQKTKPHLIHTLHSVVPRTPWRIGARGTFCLQARERLSSTSKFNFQRSIARFTRASINIYTTESAQCRNKKIFLQ